MPEIREPRRHPMIIPLVEHVERVLGTLNPQPSWFYGPEDEHEPTPEPDPDGGDGAGGNNRKPPTTCFGEPIDKPPFNSSRGARRHGPLGGYRSFRYFDPSRPEYKPTTGRAIPEAANIWGVILPNAVIENQARLLHRSRTGSWPKSLTASDTKEARDVLYQYYLVHFLVDRACEIIENIVETATGVRHDLFLSNTLVPGRTSSPQTLTMLSALSHHRMYHYAKSRDDAHQRHLGRVIPAPTLPSGTVGATYAQLLSNLLALALKAGSTTLGQDTERILGLNFLVGADIPTMAKPDLHYKFDIAAKPTKLPLHSW